MTSFLLEEGCAEQFPLAQQGAASLLGTVSKNLPKSAPARPGQPPPGGRAGMEAALTAAPWLQGKN